MPDPITTLIDDWWRNGSRTTPIYQPRPLLPRGYAPAPAEQEAAPVTPLAPAPNLPDVAFKSGLDLPVASVRGLPAPPPPVINNGLDWSQGGTPIMPPRDMLGTSGQGQFGTFSNSFRTPAQQGYGQQLGLVDALMDRARQTAPNIFGPGGTSVYDPAHHQHMQSALGGIIQHVAPGIMPNQLGQGNLDLERLRTLGIPGVPGSIQNAAGDSLNRTRENDRYGPEARYDSFYNQAYGNFPPGTPHDARVRQLRQQGMNPPEFLSGRPRGSPIDGVTAQGGTPRTPPGPDANQGQVDQAFETGLSSFPRSPQTGVRVVPNYSENPNAVHGAITTIMSQLGDNHLQAPEVRQRMVDQFGTQALDEWLNTSNNLMNYMSGPGSRQQQQIQRYLRLGGMRQSPINPFSSGASPMQRTLSAIPLVQGVNWGLLR